MYLIFIQDKDDDVKVGVKSSALRLGNNTKPWLAGFTAVMMPALAAAGIACDQTWPYYAGVAAVTGHLLHQVSICKFIEFLFQ